MEYQSKKSQDLKTIRKKVRLILEEIPETRENDQLLIINYLEREGINGWTKLLDAAKKQSISFESIRRARQYIQAAGEFLPADETVIRKRKLQEVYAAVFRNEGTSYETI